MVDGGDDSPSLSSDRGDVNGCSPLHPVHGLASM
jgi:hypothetical protein